MTPRLLVAPLIAAATASCDRPEICLDASMANDAVRLSVSLDAEDFPRCETPGNRPRPSLAEDDRTRAVRPQHVPPISRAAQPQDKEGVLRAHRAPKGLVPFDVPGGHLNCMPTWPTSEQIGTGVEKGVDVDFPELDGLALYRPFSTETERWERCKDGAECHCIVAFCIDARGQPTPNMEMLKLHPACSRDSLIDLISKWRFKPYQVEGIRTPVCTTVALVAARDPG